jgi:hypothetical protein
VTVTLSGMAPAQEQAWEMLLRLDDARVPWVLIGGQMMYLLAAEHGTALPRTTVDADVLVDIRASPGSIETLCAWLEERGLKLEHISPDNVGHRFSRPADPGPGKVSFDVLAPEGVGERAETFTVRPARTVQVPASQTLLGAAETVAVELLPAGGGPPLSGVVHRPGVLAALIGKAAATQIPARTNPERDYEDAALLLTLVDDPVAARTATSRRDLRRLRALEPLQDPDHAAWRPLTPTARRDGVATARLLLQA